MSNEDNDRPAFPCVDNWRKDSGMSLRDYFAAKAMAAYIVDCENNHMSGAEIAKASFDMANKMLKARES